MCPLDTPPKWGGLLVSNPVGPWHFAKPLAAMAAAPRAGAGSPGLPDALPRPSRAPSQTGRLGGPAGFPQEDASNSGFQALSPFTSAPTRTSASTWPLPGFVPEFFPSCVSVLATAPAVTPPPDRDPRVRPGISSPSLPQGQSSQTLTEDTPVLSASCPSPDPPKKSLHPSNPVHGYHISPRKPRKQAHRSAIAINSF